MGFIATEHEKYPEDHFFSFTLGELHYSVLIFYENIFSYSEAWEKHLSVLESEPFSVKSDNSERNSLADTIFSPSLSKNPNRHSESLKKVSIIQTPIYLPKAMALVSKIPSYRNHFKMMAFLRKKSLKTLKFPIENIIASFILDIPKPTSGFIKLRYRLDEESITIKDSKLNKLPFLDFDLKFMISFTSREIITIFKHLLLERNVVFFSKKLSLLNKFIECFSILLYPFDMKARVAPIVPGDTAPDGVLIPGSSKLKE